MFGSHAGDPACGINLISVFPTTIPVGVLPPTTSSLDGADVVAGALLSGVSQS